MIILAFFLFVLMLYVPVNNFSAVPGQYPFLFGLNQYSTDDKASCVVSLIILEPATLQSQVYHSTNEPPRSLN